MRLLAALIAIVLLAAPAARADTELADPKPDWDNPRRIVLQLTEDDPKRVNGILYNAVNLQKFYGTDNVKVAVLAYGAGVRALLKKGAPAPERVKALQDYGVEFVACGNSLDTMGKGAADLLPDVKLVTAGIAELVERQIKGWHVIVP